MRNQPATSNENPKVPLPPRVLNPTSLQAPRWSPRDRRRRQGPLPTHGTPPLLIIMGNPGETTNQALGPHLLGTITHEVEKEPLCALPLVPTQPGGHHPSRARRPGLSFRVLASTRRTTRISLHPRFLALLKPQQTPRQHPQTCTGLSGPLHPTQAPLHSPQSLVPI